MIKIINFFISENVNKTISYINYVLLFILFVFFMSGGISGSAVLLVTKSGLKIEYSIAILLTILFWVGIIIEKLLKTLKNSDNLNFYDKHNHSWIVFFITFSLLAFWYSFQLNCEHLELVSNNNDKLVYVSSESNIEILNSIYMTLIIYFSINAIFSPYLFFQAGRR